MMPSEDAFQSRIPAYALDTVLEVASVFGVDAAASIASEDYFARLVQAYKGRPSGLSAYLREHLACDFVFLTAPPVWIQNPDWQFLSGKPMRFVGQVDVAARSGVFHDDASFYVFWDPASGLARTVIQVA